jgi:3-isopropylmalate/(R)-2-methylmalate dehydratase large subunit
MIFAAAILNGHKVKVPTFVVPGSTEVHSDMLKLDLRGVPKANGQKSIMDVLADAGCTIGPSGCSACLGGPVDTFGRLNEPMTCVSTTNRNFPGRMGHKDAGVYLASPLTAAASAINGKITDPRDYVTGPIPTGSAGLV